VLADDEVSALWRARRRGAIAAPMNEQTLAPNPEEVVPVPVPAAAIEELLAPEKPSKSAPDARASKPAAIETRAPSAVAADQLPTTRLPSIASILPPPLPPPGPAHKTQPLKAISRDAATVKLADTGNRRPWKKVLGHVTRAAAGAPSRMHLGALRGEAWTQRRVGALAVTLGAAMIVGALVFGCLNVTTERFGQSEPASIVAALILARAAIAIATMVIGFGLMRVGERTILSSRPDARSAAS
jgi:hypothetical protein